MSSKQDILNAKVVDQILSVEFVQPECEIFRLNDFNGDYYRQMVAEVAEDINVVSSLPTIGNHNIFILATDGPTAFIRKVIANIEQSDNGSFKFGSVMLLDSPELKDRGYVGVIFLPVATSNVLRDLPNKFVCDNVEYSFKLVVFITSNEYRTWKQMGHDSLMDLFTESNKDLIAY